MSTPRSLPGRGDFITLEAPRERSAVAICVGHTGAGALRVRRLGGLRFPERRRCPAFETITTYRGTWRALPVTDPRHPAFDPVPDATLEEMGL